MRDIETPTVIAESADPTPVSSDQQQQSLIPAWLRKSMMAIVALFFFVLALELLKKGAGPLGPFLKTTLGIKNATNTLGFGWLVAYGVLSGSPVAAIALSFFDQHVITDVQTFSMITGSRLGASFIVLFVGFLYYLRGHKRGASIAIGRYTSRPIR